MQENVIYSVIPVVHDLLVLSLLPNQSRCCLAIQRLQPQLVGLGSCPTTPLRNLTSPFQNPIYYTHCFRGSAAFAASAVYFVYFVISCICAAMPGSDIRLLALDGGGVRGLSSLLILQQLMAAVDPESPPKPCDYFDMIGGTSTGGLIAIMLGRLA